MPSRDRHMVNVKRTYPRLLEERERIRRAALRGDIRLPDFGHDQGIPLWFVIERLLDFKDAYRRRLTRAKRRQSEQKRMVLNAADAA